MNAIIENKALYTTRRDPQTKALQLIIPMSVIFGLGRFDVLAERLIEFHSALLSASLLVSPQM